MAEHLATIDAVGRKKPKPVDASPKPRPGYAVFARVREEIGEALERYFGSKRLPPTLTSVVEAALEDFLASEGFPVASPKEGGSK
jgi:hypothetical protein